MTTTLAAPTPTWHSVCPEHLAPMPHVLTISGLPVGLRARVEELMVEHLPPADADAAPGTDIWDTQWFTRWQPDRTRFGARAVRCREVLVASPDAISRFRRQLEQLADENGCLASVDRA